MFKTRCVIFFIVLLNFLLIACNQSKNTCTIQVGDTCITAQEFKDRLERFAEESLISSEETLQQMKPIVVDNIVEENLILQYARKGFITVTDKEIDIAMKGLMDGTEKNDLEQLLTEECRDLSDMREFIRRRTIINRTVEIAVKKEIAVPPEKIKQYYEDHTSEFYRPASVELYHVFVKKHFKAKEALVMLRSGMSLEQVVRQYSSPEENNGSGFMGIFVKGDLPKEVEDVVFSIPERRYSEIIETQRGYHIFYVAKRTKPGTLPLINASDQIRDNLAEELFETRYADFIDTLKKEYIIEVDWNEINSITVKE
jgi:parvulin-like peptidyl-prolyl isomerase